MTDLNETDLNPGSRYELKKIRGQGSYGIVGAYKDKKSGKKVAIKRMHKIEDLIDAKRMLREIRILNYFRHENIIDLKRAIYNTKPGEEFGEVYLVTNLMDVDLNKLINKNREELTDDHIQYITYQIFRGLKYLHTGDVIHRDIKPSNILADEDCEIQLCDFGFAREVALNSGGMTEYVVTRFYRAPEVMLDSQHYSKAVDIWSVGCTFYELITGKPLFKAPNYLDLVKMMIKVLGKPDEDQLKFITNEHALKYIQELPPTQPRKPTDGVKYENPLALDLIDKCLKFDPSKRLTVEKVLCHPYFDGLSEGEKEPSFKGKVDFSFEKDKNVTLFQVKKMILEEINKVNTFNKEETYDVEEIVATFPDNS